MGAAEVAMEDMLYGDNAVRTGMLIGPSLSTIASPPRLIRRNRSLNR